MAGRLAINQNPFLLGVFWYHIFANRCPGNIFMIIIIAFHETMNGFFYILNCLCLSISTTTGAGKIKNDY